MTGGGGESWEPQKENSSKEEDYLMGEDISHRDWACIYQVLRQVVLLKGGAGKVIIKKNQRLYTKGDTNWCKIDKYKGGRSRTKFINRGLHFDKRKVPKRRASICQLMESWTWEKKRGAKSVVRGGKLTVEPIEIHGTSDHGLSFVGWIPQNNHARKKVERCPNDALSIISGDGEEEGSGGRRTHFLE